MDWQTIAVFLILLCAFLFVSRRIWQKLRAFSSSNGGDCATGCGKCGTQTTKTKF